MNDISNNSQNINQLLNSISNIDNENVNKSWNKLENSITSTKKMPQNIWKPIRTCWKNARKC